MAAPLSFRYFTTGSRNKGKGKPMGSFPRAFLSAFRLPLSAFRFPPSAALSPLSLLHPVLNSCTEKKVETEENEAGDKQEIATEE
jgi:hypothetical protein